MKNRPGQLAILSRDLANAGVNIETLAAITSGLEGFIKLVVDDDVLTRQVLENAGMRFDERRIISAVLYDQPGALADMAEALAATSVNIEAIYLLRSSGEGLHFAVAVNEEDAPQK